jgi:hypothetical protein
MASNRHSAARRPFPEMDGLRQDRTRIGERTISSGENPKLEKHLGMLRMVRAQPLLLRPAGKEDRLLRTASRMN